MRIGYCADATRQHAGGLKRSMADDIRKGSDRNLREVMIGVGSWWTWPPQRHPTGILSEEWRGRRDFKPATSAVTDPRPDSRVDCHAERARARAVTLPGL